MGLIRLREVREEPAASPVDRAAFEELVRRVHGPLRRYAHRRVGDAADDIVADTLLVAWRRFDDVPVDAELAWCYAVARNHIANLRRGHARRLRLVERVAAQPLVPVTDHCDGDPLVESALEALDAKDREILRLWAWERLEPREIAVVLDISPNAASIRLHRARRRLENALNDLGAGPDRRKNGAGVGQNAHDDPEGAGR